jgi:hypothetical protein
VRVFFAEKGANIDRHLIWRSAFRYVISGVWGADQLFTGEREAKRAAPILKGILMEKLIMLVLIAYTIGVLVGEKIRDRMYRSEKNGTVILAFLF